MQNIQKKPLTVAVKAAVLLTVVSVANAQEQVTATESDSNSAVLDEIVVTSGKIDRSLKDTIDSVNVTTAERITANPSLKDFKDVLRNTANITSEGDYGFSIRGIDDYGPTNGGTAPVYNVIVDGVTQQRFGIFEGTLSTWDMEQVEVLRGPQSTTAGQNALAGSIVIRSKDPEFEQGGIIQTGYGTDNTYQFALANTGAITENLAYRISTEKKYTDGNIYNTFFKQDDWNNRETVTVRGKLLYLINDDSDIKLTVNYVNQDEAGDGSQKSISTKDFINDYNEASVAETTNNNFAVEYNSQLSDNWSIKATTAYIDSTYTQSKDFDGSNGFARWDSEVHAKHLSQEALFNYDDDDKLKAVVGLHLAKGDTHNPGITTDAPFSIPTPAGMVNATLDTNSEGNDEFDNYAVFFNADYKLTPKLTLLSGLRYDYDKRISDSVSTVKLAKPTPYGAAVDKQIQLFLDNTVGYSSGEHVNKVWLPKIGLDYAWNDNFSTGLQYKKGYRPGGTSLNIVTLESKDFDPEYTDNFELSARYQDDDGKLSLKGNLFYTNWKDQQVTVYGESGIAYDSHDTNAGKSHLYGMELEGSYQATPELLFTAGLGTVKTEFDEYDDNGTDYKGKEFANARRITANLGVTYHAPSGWFVGGHMNYQGKGWQDIDNTIKLDPYALFNLNTGYASKNWKVQAYVNNVFDKRYVTREYNPQPDNSLYLLGNPRTIGVNFNYQW